MKIPSPRANRKARIEIIPLIDIIFFLLATFVMVSLSMVKNQAVPVSLPIATTSTPQDRTSFASITITESGELFYNKEALSLSDLLQRLQKFKSEQQDPRVLINGDEKAYFGKAIEVLDEVRKLGITKVAIQTKNKSPS
jgi:biopolymer transport protein ExbD